MKLCKYSIFLLLALLLTLSLAACGGKGKETETDDDPAVGGLSVGDTVTMGSYPMSSSSAREDILWRVLKIEEGRALLIAEDCLDYVPFDSEAHQGDEAYNWQNSDIRAWLNGSFYDTVFTDAEKDKILNGGAEETVVISTAANPMTDIGACGDTYDKVFLLSCEEAKALFADDADRAASVTAYAEKNGVRANNGNGAWWLRTMGSDPNRAAVVLYSGAIQYSGYHIVLGSAGIRPCIWITAETDAVTVAPVALESAEVGDLVSFGSYEQDGDSENGKEPILWQVLSVEEDRVLVISKDCLDAQKYHAAFNTVIWKDSSLCKWLNSTFLRAAFTEEEQASLVAVTVPTVTNSQTGLDTGEDAQNRIFLLSIDELISYLPTPKDRQARPTPYAINRGVSLDNTYGTCAYWLRDIGKASQYASYTYYYGEINYQGAAARSTFVAVRPAMWIRMPSE